MAVVHGRFREDEDEVGGNRAQDVGEGILRGAEESGLEGWRVAPTLGCGRRESGTWLT